MAEPVARDNPRSGFMRLDQSTDFARLATDGIWYDYNGADYGEGIRATAMYDLIIGR